MKLENKIGLCILAAVAATAAGAFISSCIVAKRTEMSPVYNGMAAIMDRAQAVGIQVSDLHRSDVFDQKVIADLIWAKEQQEWVGEEIPEGDVRAMIPLVAAMQSITGPELRNQFDFSIVTHPALEPRNPDNQPGVAYAKAFDAFAGGAPESFIRDETTNQFTLVRPIRMLESCLSCHGDPSKSKTSDGKDIYGFAMEGLEVGDIKGAFVLKTNGKADFSDRGAGGRVGVFLFLILLASAPLLWLLGRFLVKSLEHTTRSLEASADQIAGVADRVSVASQTVAEGSGQQEALVAKCNASLEEINLRVRRNADGASRAQRIAAETHASADTGLLQMKELKEAIDAIRAANDDVARIIGGINEGAFTTRILALCASVESARAEESGAGLAIVADQVCDLAKLSARSAEETATKVGDVMARIGRANYLNKRVAANFGNIVIKVRSLDELVSGISLASTEQTRGILRATTAAAEMMKVTQASAVTAVECFGSSGELGQQARMVRKAVSAMDELRAGNFRTQDVAGAPGSDR